MSKTKGFWEVPNLPAFLEVSKEVPRRSGNFSFDPGKLKNNDKSKSKGILGSSQLSRMLETSHWPRKVVKNAMWKSKGFWEFQNLPAKIPKEVPGLTQGSWKILPCQNPKIFWKFPNLPAFRESPKEVPGSSGNFPYTQGSWKIMPCLNPKGFWEVPNLPAFREVPGDSGNLK